jgi:plastocyanin
VIDRNKIMKPCHVVFLLFIALLLSGCSQSPSPQPAGSPSPQKAVATVIDNNTVGTISGTISFKGPAPKLPALDLSADPACPTDPQPQDVVVVKNAKLANVFVYIKSGLGQASFAPPSEPAVLDQKGCRYVPHVLGLMVGQPLKVLNNDNAEHNVHPMPKQNAEWNESQMPRGQPIVKTFKHPEIMIPVQCNQHPWMEMYVNVLAHPFFAVSAEDGSFQIKDLPPGDYTLAAVHEKFGEQTMSITVAPKQTASANFVFAGSSK